MTANDFFFDYNQLAFLALVGFFAVALVAIGWGM